LAPEAKSYGSIEDYHWLGEGEQENRGCKLGRTGLVQGEYSFLWNTLTERKKNQKGFRGGEKKGIEGDNEPT